jgi:hypothetical protein
MKRSTESRVVSRFFAGLSVVGVVSIWTSARADIPVDACTMLSKADVSSALGIAVDPGARPIATEPRMCNWRESDKASGPGRNVLLTFIPENTYEKLKTEPLAAPATGVGDEAVVTHPMRMPPILSVKAGANYFQILVRSGLQASEEVNARNQAIEKSLAAKIIKKLG